MRPSLFYIICLLLSTPFGVIAQTEDAPYDKLFSKYTTGARLKDTSFYVCIVKGEILSSVQIVRTLADSLAVVKLVNKESFDAVHKRTRLVPANDNWKKSPTLERYFEKKKTVVNEYVLTALSVDRLLSSLHNIYKEAEIVHVHQLSNSVVVRCTATYLENHLLKCHEIIFADVVQKAHTETAIIGYNRSLHGINAVDYLLPGANGKGITAGVKEQKIDEADIDLTMRVLASPLAAPSQSYHATAIASIIGGAGNSFYNGRGIAWNCRFFPSSFSNLLADDTSILNFNKVSVQNHSYGTIIQQFYGAEALSYDVLTWNNKVYLPVFSSGNQGNAAPAEGKYANPSGFANLTGNFKMAKNIISVGAIDDQETVAPLSSAGPGYDGRLMPQLTAHGPGGTSDAAALVSGTIAAMQQVYADSNNKMLPAASLVKAVLFTSADDIYKSGIDYRTGFGLLNSYGAVKAIKSQQYDGSTISASQEWIKTIVVPAEAAQLKVTLAWTDSAASVNSSKAIINDLDLEVIDVNSGSVYLPWVLSSAASIDSLNKLPIRKRDSLNTAEQVSILLPVAGTYLIKVKGTSVVNSSLPFHIAYRIDTLNTFTFTNPLHASDVNKSNGQVTVRWRTFVADTGGRGNLFISYNSGAGWQQIGQGIKLAAGKYQWQIKDTNSTALLKMETAFGHFFSRPFIVSGVTNPQLDFKCSDSFRLSWNSHVYANAYRIYELTDSPYLQPIRTVTDTFLVLQKSLYPSRVYAVEPLLNNGLPAARSMAINIESQGVKCFYKTLNYHLLDTNRLMLVLELSTTSYSDSVFFEQVTVAGNLLRTYGGSKVTRNDLSYTYLVDAVSGGITYLRGRIKLNNGAMVYTDIVPVLTSGEKNIWFYPNPVKRNGTVKYVLKQGVPSYSALQLYDMFGRLLRNFSSLPNEIDVSTLPAGIIIYRLLDSQNNTLETGKLVVQ